MIPYKFEVYERTNITVGAIANEAALDAKYIGRIEIYDNYSTVDLPDGMPRDVFEQLKTTSVSGQQLRISVAAESTHAEGMHAEKRIPLSAPRKGGDRHVAEKRSADKKPFKSDAGTAKPKPKPHRKGQGGRG